MTLPTDKSVLRKEMQEIRGLIPEDEIIQDSGKLAGHITELCLAERDSCIAGYIPVRSEIDPRPILEGYRARKFTVALPAVVNWGFPLVFRVWDGNTRLIRDGFGILTPDSAAQKITPAILLVPLLAFDADGHRLGYGGGYYDRTIKFLRSRAEITAIGVAFDFQGPMDIPVEEHDQQLDWVITPNQVYRMNVFK